VCKWERGQKEGNGIHQKEKKKEGSFSYFKKTPAGPRRGKNRPSEKKKTTNNGKKERKGMKLRTLRTALPEEKKEKKGRVLPRGGESGSEKKKKKVQAHRPRYQAKEIFEGKKKERTPALNRKKGKKNRGEKKPKGRFYTFGHVQPVESRFKKGARTFTNGERKPFHRGQQKKKKGSSFTPTPGLKKPGRRGGGRGENDAG